MIAGTNTDCKIINISVTGSKATITCLLFATKLTTPAKAFQFYFRDNDDIYTPTLLSPNIYWVDKYNNYENNVANIDINKYKEVMLEVDITKANTADIQSNRWIRKGNLMLINTETNYDQAKPAWISENLTLISTPFELPEIINFSVWCNTVQASPENDGVYIDMLKLNVSFDVKYKFERDFNYNNTNFGCKVYIKSPTTKELIEEKDFISGLTLTNNSITMDDFYFYNRPILIEIVITDKKGNVFYTFGKTYTPVKKNSNTYIKVDDSATGIRKVYAFYIKRDPHEDDDKEAWL